MSKEGDRAAVFRTTKVRTKLKGDASWMQRQDQPDDKIQEEKPWIAEVRASRLNGAPNDTSPVSSPTKSTPAPSTSETESRAPTSGYLIRGVFTKLDAPAATATSNGIKTTQFTKKPSESYKRIAPHTVRPTSDQEGQLSPTDLEKRTEAASNVLARSTVKKRSYVLSAAKKFETKDASPDTSLINSSPSFVATRVEISDDDERAVTPAPTSVVLPSDAVTSAPKALEIDSNTVHKAADLAVNVPVAPKMEQGTPEPVNGDPLTTEKDLPKEVNTQPEELEIPAQSGTPLVKLLPISSPPKSATPSSTVPESPVPAPLPTVSPVPEIPTPVSPTPASPAADITEKTETETASEPELKPESEPEPEPEPEPETKMEPKLEPEPKLESKQETETDSKLSPGPSSSVDTLAALSGTLISFDTNSSSFKDDEPALAQEETGPADSHTADKSVEQGPAPALSNGEPLTDDLLGFGDGPEESAEPVPPSPGRWSHDLLSGMDSESNPEKTGVALDLQADDVIVSKTEERSLNLQPEEKKQTDETAKETQSSADPFDPYPIGTTSHNSSFDLLQPHSEISINSSSPSSIEIENSSPEIDSTTLESLADDVVPIDTDTTSLSSQRSWTRTWEVSSPQQTNTEESQEPEPEEEGQAADQQTVIMFETEFNGNGPAWKKWSSPIVYTLTTTPSEEEEEEIEEEESPEDIETVTTITTIREIHNEPEPSTDESVTHSTTVVEERKSIQTPEPDTKKGFVYVKEYVNASELSLHNPKDTTDSGSDYLASSSTSYLYSSPPSYSRASLTSTCTYCGEQVGNDAKITLEHLNINCHPECFKCELCRRPMGDLLSSMFLHGGKVHCETCYATI